MLRCTMVLAAAILALGTGALHAQSFPSKIIRIIVPFTPGGGPDVLARNLGPKLQERLGQTVIVENKPGAGGIIGTELVVRSAPDGHTLVITTTALTSYKWVTKTMPFEMASDLAPVGVAASLPLVVAVGNAVPIQSVAELIAYAKANPGKLSYASSGTGTLQHLSVEMFKDMTGTDIVHIPYKGAAGMLNDLLAGQVHMMFGALNSAIPHIQSGRIRALALGDRTRNPILDVPTVNETVPGFEATFWFGLAVPSATPAAIVSRLSAEQRAILAMPDVRARLAAAGFDVTPSTPEEMRARLAAESERWRRVADAARITPE